MSSKTRPFNLATIDVLDLTKLVAKEGAKAIGSGSSADVWKGRYTRPGHKPVLVALKILRSSSLSDRRIAEKIIRRLEREAKVWSTLNHPNVAGFIGICYEQVGAYSVPCLVSHFYEQKTLKDNLDGILQGQRVKFFYQLLCGLAYLHSMNVIHGDLKPTNVLVDRSFKAVLIDFGLSRVLGASGFTTSSMKAPGTTRYMAPELIDPETPSTTPLATKQSDIWSAGMTGLEILSGVIPYAQIRTEHQLIPHICRSEIPNRALYPKVSEHQWDMLKDSWARRGRPSADIMAAYLKESYM